jgi:integrase
VADITGIHTLLKKMFNLALDWGYCAHNPVLKVKLFSERDNLKERVLSEEEEAKLLEQCPRQLKPIVIAALNTGMRRNEILMLKWEQVDLKTLTLQVTRTKSGKNRMIPINNALLEVLNIQRQNVNSNFVFPNPENGEPFRSIRNGFISSCRRAGIENLRFHDLRHTFGTRLIQKGVDIVTVQNLLGHRNVTITQRYTHTSSVQKREAVDLLVEKVPKHPQKQEELLLICDTGSRREGQISPSSTVSTN